MIHLRVIGESSIEIGDTKLGPDSELLFSLLLYLIAERGRVIPRARLVELFWPDVDERGARHCLRQALYSLRKLQVPVESRPGGVFLPPSSATADWESASVYDAFGTGDEALDTTGGFHLAWPSAHSPLFESWSEGFRARVSRLLRERLIRALVDARERSDWTRASRLATRILSLDPLNEEATLTLAEATALDGSKQAAIFMLDQYLREVGCDADLRVQASVLRKRVSERFSETLRGGWGFVGRLQTLAWLSTLVARIHKGEGVSAFVYAPAGMGKTRLISEFGAVLDVRGVRRIKAGCQSNGADQPLSVVRQLVTSLLQLPGALGCSPEKLALVRRITAQHEDVSTDGEFADPRVLHAAVRAAVRDLVDAVASESQLVIVVEDLHWIDPSSLEVLIELSSSNRDRSVLLLYTSRIEPRQRMLERIDRRQLHIHQLPALGSEESRNLVQLVCARLNVSADEGLIQRIARLGSGNPLYLSELVAGWRDTGDIARLPNTIENLLVERLSRIPEVALRVMQVLAVIERRVMVDEIAGVLDMPRWEALGALDTLQKADLAGIEEGNWAVRHDLMASASLAIIEPSTRQVLHRRVAEHLHERAKHGADPSALLEAANHWYAAGLHQPARDAALESAGYLMNVGLPEAAAQIIGDALRYTESRQARVELFALRNRYLLAAGDTRGSAANCAEAVDTCLVGEPGPHTLAEVELFSGWHHALTVPPPIVIELALRCAHDASASSEHRLSASIFALVEMLAEPPFDRARHLASLVDRIPLTEGGAARQRAVFQVIYYTEFCQFERARSAGEELVAESWDGDPVVRARALRMSSYPLRALGERDEAVRRLRLAIELAQSARSLSSQWESHMQLMGLYDDYGDYTEAWKSYETACGCADRLPSSSRAKLDLLGAIANLRRNDPIGALSLLARHSRDGTVITFRADFLSAIVRAHLLLGRMPAAAEVTDLERLVTGMRGRPNLDFPVGTLCAVYRALGRPCEARQLADAYLATRGISWAPTDPWLLVSVGHFEPRKDAATSLPETRFSGQTTRRTGPSAGASATPFDPIALQSFSN